MDCVLINPIQKLPYVDYHHNGLKIDNRMTMPLCLAYCASILEKNKFSVKIIDANFLRIENKEVVNKLDNPKTVVITTSPIDRWECPYINIIYPVELANLIKQKYPNTKIIFIGPHGSTQPDWVFSKSENIDAIIRGEPEFTLLELVKRISKNRPYENVLGITLRDRKNVDRKLIDLNKLPSPAFHLLPLEEYKTKKGWAYMLTSRGCIYKCTFCLKKMFGGDNFRYHSIKKVVDEMELLERKYGFDKVYFLDLEFSINKERAKKICKEIIRRGLTIQWACNVRWNDLDDELLTLMKQANCIKVKPGIESCSEVILKNIQKGINKEIIAEGVKLCRKHEMPFDCYGMICMPGETMETLKESIEFQATHNLEFGGGFCIPYPGTPLFEQAKQQTNNPNLTWDDLAAITGKVGTNILNKYYNINTLYRKIRSLYYKKKFGSFFYANPKFWKFIKKKIKK